MTKLGAMRSRFALNDRGSGGRGKAFIERSDGIAETLRYLTEGSARWLKSRVGGEEEAVVKERVSI